MVLVLDDEAGESGFGSPDMQTWIAELAGLIFIQVGLGEWQQCLSAAILCLMGSYFQTHARSLWGVPEVLKW